LEFQGSYDVLFWDACDLVVYEYLSMNVDIRVTGLFLIAQAKLAIRNDFSYPEMKAYKRFSIGYVQRISTMSYLGFMNHFQGYIGKMATWIYSSQTRTSRR
jgi:hypothetical protein